MQILDDTFIINADKIPKESTLLDEKLNDQLRTAFSKLEEEVVLKTIVNLENDKDRELAGFLEVIHQC